MTEAAAKKSERARNTIIISLAVIIFVLLSILFLLIYTIINTDKVYKGVYVDGINAGGLTRDELKEVLEKKYKYELDNLKVTLVTDKHKEKYSLSDFNVNFDVDATVEKAFSIGREGNIIERLNRIFMVNFNEEIISPEISYDEKKLSDIVASFHEKNFVLVKNPSLTIDNNAVIINSGRHGESIDKEYLENEIRNFLRNRNISRIDVPVITTRKEKADPDEYYHLICREPVNAKVRVGNNNMLEIVPHENGRQIDKDFLNETIKDINANENIVRTLPVTLIEPEITSEKLNENLFKDALATFKTYFLTDTQYNINRSENLRIAVECINGTILAPGDIFSFDKTLGERTEEKGYKPAKVFWGGEIIDSVGGGICQVSTTLYNAVLQADLDVLERHNHSFVVAYIPIGMDAAVAYQTIDFKFRNSSNWPIKIIGRMTPSNELVFTILGTRENPGKTVEYYTQVVNTTNYNTVYINDPTLPEGTIVVRQDGINGYVVDTYKVVRQNGQEVSRFKLNTSVYIPLNKEILHGTKKEQPLQEYQEYTEHTGQQADQSPGQLPEEGHGQLPVQEMDTQPGKEPARYQANDANDGPIPGQQADENAIPSQPAHENTTKEPHTGNHAEEPVDMPSN